MSTTGDPSSKVSSTDLPGIKTDTDAPAAVSLKSAVARLPVLQSPGPDSNFLDWELVITSYFDSVGIDYVIESPLPERPIVVPSTTPPIDDDAPLDIPLAPRFDRRLAASIHAPHNRPRNPPPISSDSDSDSSHNHIPISPDSNSDSTYNTPAPSPSTTSPDVTPILPVTATSFPPGQIPTTTDFPTSHPTTLQP
ncbi:hypothetical protein PCANC_24529 [Puccinia coronata f. sp. avenae]|uniref:Uncharacterized protein n=1 Tax=Puccinia coronata f. sp. avenae TaxID=200324 RepID=A0A2N5TXB6_9BASI|nr:hypothetical protein PCANC_24529 [Puccinia coronata f. sp. avenae]